MKSNRVIIALIAALIVAVIISGCGTPQVNDPDKFINDARELVSKAATEKSSVKRDKDYNAAIGKYNAVAGAYKDKPQGAQALFELGVLYQTAPESIKNLNQSYTEFSTLLNRFGKTRAELVRREFLANEIDQVQSLVTQAKEKRDSVATELDHENATNSKWGAKYLYATMDFLVNATGKISWLSYWLAIIIVTVFIKLLITPLTKAQFKAMKEMQKIAPLVKEIQEKYKGDQQVIGQKTMDLYKEHHINPFASCLPMLIQMPILMLLYYMIRMYQFQFAKGTFLWIGSSLSHMKDFNVPVGAGGTVWLTAGNLSEPDLILVLLYVVSMYISTKLSTVDPTQAEQQKMMSILMPVMFAFMFAGFPSAFLLYWLVFNIIQTLQQYLILHRGSEPALATGPALPETPNDDTPRRRRRRR